MTTERMRYGGSTATPEIPKEAYHSNPTLEGHFARLRLQRRMQSMAELRCFIAGLSIGAVFVAASLGAMMIMLVTGEGQ